VKTRSQPLKTFSGRTGGQWSIHVKLSLLNLAFERDLTKKLSGEWKDKVLQKFSATARRLQLF